MVRTLISKIYYRGKELLRGFILFDEERIIDHGTEPEPEYELSELVINHEYKAYVVHGFSIALDPLKYPFRGFNEEIDLSIYSVDELKQIGLAAFYELYMNGVTLPIVYGEHAEIVNNIAREHNLSLAIIDEDKTLPRYKGVIYLDRRDDKLYLDERELGVYDELICSISRITRNCLAIDVKEFFTLNVSFIASKIYEVTGSLTKTIELLVKPYIMLDLDNGYIDKEAKPDILVYSFRDSRKLVPYNKIEYVVLRGYPPDQVFVNGDMFFDKGEPLVLLPVELNTLLLSGE